MVPVIDRDTADVAGAPDIGSTILAKIDACAAFVADVTIVNQEHGGRPSPNPNVLLELGYALKAVGWSRCVLVMNTEFGGPTELPFDLRQKRVLTYQSAPQDTERADKRGELAASLERALRPILANELPAPGVTHPVHLEMSFKKVSIASARHEYELLVDLVNDGTRPIAVWHVDVTLPAIWLMDNLTYALQVENRGDPTLARLRSSQGTHSDPIYPGDAKRVMSVPYYIDQGTYDRSVEWWHLKVTATAYVDGQTSTIERSAEDMQVF